MPTTTRSTLIPGVTPQALWDWHLRPGNFERLVPPWQQVELRGLPDPFEPGSVAHLTQRLGPLRLTWSSRLVEVDPGRGFVDVADHGPFATWRHTHRFEPVEGGTRLVDELEWSLPLGGLGQAVAGRWVARELHAFLAHRHRRTAEDLRRHAALRTPRPLRVGITGASGLVGTALTRFLRGGGHDVVPFVRGPRTPGTLPWDASKGPDPADLVGLDAVVHLAGASISELPWTPARKARIVESRVQGTHALATAMARCVAPPPVLVSASAVGFWGDRTTTVDESDGPGSGFLSDTAVAWEAAAEPARQAGLRVVHPRIGIVQSAAGGMLGEVLPLFRLGLGGRLGTGNQPLSWVALDDLVAMICQAIVEPSWSGPFAAVAPEPTTQGAWAARLAHTLHRPRLAPAPAWAIRALYGEGGRALLLGGAPVLPTALKRWGFTWLRGDLEDALRHEVGALEPDDGT